MYKSPIFFLLTIYLLLCCDSPDVYHICGYTDCADDKDTVSIFYLNNDDSREFLSQAIVTDGKFHFEGTVNGDRIANIHISSHGKELCSTFFIEKGNIELHIGDSSCKATGTPLNEMYTIILDSIAYYIDCLEGIEDLYYSGVMDCELLAQLGAMGIGMQEKLVDFLRMRIKENIGNPLGLYLLVVYNRFFSTEELWLLFSQSSVKSRQFYDMMHDVVDERPRLQ